MSVSAILALFWSLGATAAIGLLGWGAALIVEHAMVRRTSTRVLRSAPPEVWRAR